MSNEGSVVYAAAIAFIVLSGAALWTVAAGPCWLWKWSTLSDVPVRCLDELRGKP